MSPVTAFFRAWGETRRHPSINVTCDSFLECVERENQCCGSGSGIRCLFDPWIRDRFFPDPGSRIPNPYFWELSDNFLGKKFYNSLKICPNFFLQHFKTNIRMSPVTAFLMAWRETPIKQCHQWQSWGVEGDTKKSIKITCDCLLQGHLWLPSWGCGRWHKSINTTYRCPPVTTSLKLWKQINQQSLDQFTCDCLLKVLETNQPINLLNVSCDCLLKGVEGGPNPSTQPTGCPLWLIS